MMIFEFEDTPLHTARMKVVGVGGAGGNGRAWYATIAWVHSFSVGIVDGELRF